MNHKRFNGFCLLLLWSLYKNCETSPIVSPIDGQKGGNVTLPCQYEGSEIADMSLIGGSESIGVCQTEECSCRVCKIGACDVFIKDLSFRDAGKYTLSVYHHNDQTELEPHIRMYQLRVDGEVSVKMGEELELDVLVSNADEVQHQSRRSTGWKKIWSRTEGVKSERINFREGNLIINEFTFRDEGSYVVLDPDGNILIMVKVRAEKLN